MVAAAHRRSTVQCSSCSKNLPYTTHPHIHTHAPAHSHAHAHIHTHTHTHTHTCTYARSWIKGCYDHPVAITPGPTTTATVLLDLPTSGNVAVDRIVLRENQTDGQQIAAYKVEALGADGSWSTVVTGQSIGNKAIQLLADAKGVVARQFRFTATGFVDPSKPSASLLSFGVHMCDRSGNQTGCSYIKDTSFSHTPAEILKTITGSSANVCCSSCSAIPQCTCVCAISCVRLLVCACVRVCVRVCVLIRN